MKKNEIIKRTPDENKALLIEAVGGRVKWKAFYAVIGNVNLNTGATDNYDNEIEVYETYDSGLGKLSIMKKYGWLLVGQYDYWLIKFKAFKAKLKI